MRMMTQRALLLVSLFLSFSAFAAVSAFGPEQPLSPATIVPSNTIQTNVAVATNGDGFLAAWFDSRDQQGTYATRIDADGHVIDHPSFLIAPEQGAVAATGDGRDTIVAILVCGGIDLFRIDENRNVSAPVHVTTDNICFGSVSLATNGDTIVVAYGGRVAVFDHNLNLTKRFAIDVTATYAAVATNGSDYVVITGAQSPNVISAHLDASGALVSTEQLTFPNNVNSLAIASNGNEYLSMAGGPILSAQRLSANGSPIDGGKMVHVASSPRPVMTPKIVWDGSEYIATYVQSPLLSTSQTAAVVRVNANADVLGEQSIGGAREAAVAFRNGRAAVVSVQSNARVQMFSPDNLTALTLPVAISTSAPHQSTPKIVNVDGTLTTFWIEHGSDVFQLKAKIGNGAVKTLIDSVLNDYSVGFDGFRYVVVWSNAVSINVQRFERDLTPLDPSPVSFAPITPFMRPVAAIANGRALIAWPQVQDNDYAMKAMVVDTTIATMTFPQPVTLSSPPLSNGVPAVTWNGNEFVVVWPHQTEPYLGLLPYLPPDELLARHVSRDGAVLDDTFVVARPDLKITWLAAAGDYVAWVQGDMVFGKRIRAEGNAAPIGAITVPGGVNVATYRGGYVVAWPAPGSTYTTYSPALRLVDANGTPSTMYALSEMPHAFMTDDVDFESGLIVYMRTANELQYGGVSRLFTRTFEPVPPKARAAAR